MANSRTNFHTANSIQEVYLRDFSTNFDKNPITGFLATETNEQDAKKLVRNLILTMTHERPFRPDVGTDIYKAEFELDRPGVVENWRNRIKQTINRNLPFISLISIDVLDYPAQNGIAINIVFGLTNTVNPVNVNIVIQRVR